MTLISNGPAPSLAPVNQEKTYKPESPPPNDMDRNRFKESLDKAIAQDTSVSESRENTAQKDDRAKVSSKPTDSVKKLIDEKNKLKTGKKKISEKSLEKLSLDREEKGEKIESSLVSLNEPIEEDRDLTDLKTKVLHQKSDDKKTLAENEEKSLIENPQLLVSDVNVEQMSQQKEHLPVASSKENMESSEASGEDKAVVIPFPGISDNESLTQSLVSKTGDSLKSNSLKLNNGKTSKGKEEQTLTVIDARSSERSVSDKSKFVSKTASITESMDQAAKESNQIVLGEQNTTRVSSDEIKSFENRFNENKEVLLARELKESGNDQIVKKASFILKDNNQGEIKLILKPEALGRVKIQLNMNENNLVAKIIVENSRVGQIFESNLNDLSKSFEEAGITSSSIEVSVGDGNKHNADQNNSFQNDQPYFSDRLKTLDESVPVNGRYGSESRDRLVNLVV